MNFIVIVWMSSPWTLGWSDIAECYASKSILKFNCCLKKKSGCLLFYKKTSCSTVWICCDRIFYLQVARKLVKYPVTELFSSAFFLPQGHLWLPQGIGVHCQIQEWA